MMDVTADDFRNHLDWVQQSGQSAWSALDDYALAESLVKRGDGFATAARIVGMPEDACRARWAALYPPEVRGIAMQAVLMRHLRRIALGGAGHDDRGEP